MDPEGCRPLLLLIIGLAAFSLNLCHSSRILLIPWTQKSHQLLFTRIAEELLERGHDVYVYIGQSITIGDSLHNLPVRFLKYQGKSEIDFYHKYKAYANRSSQLFMETDGSSRYLFARIQDLLVTGCRAVLSDDKLLEQMKDMTFDLAILDGSFMCRCIFLIPHRLGVPYISQLDYPEPWALGLPWLPSAFPFRVLPYSEQMTFWQRLVNTFTQIAYSWVPVYPAIPADLLEKYQQYGQVRSLAELSGKSLLYLMTSDYHLDYAFPLMPFMIPVPGLTIVPSKQLPVDLAMLLAGAHDGAVLVSFGSVSAQFPEETVKKMIAAFACIKYTVLWGYTNVYNLDLPPNVHLYGWVPQNDLLAHPKVKLFVGHGGNNGQYEALHHAVPMLVFPLKGDQFYNARRIEYKGFGAMMDINRFTADELLANILLLINNPAYKSAIDRASAIFRERPDAPLKKAAFWIEHVIQHGADHLHSYSQSMPWYQFLMLDIAALLGLVVVMLSILFILLARFLQRFCCTRREE